MEKILSEIYSKLEVKDIFKIWRLTRCDLCSKPVSNPIYLPCCYSICSSHLPIDKFLAPASSLASSIYFVCFFCQQLHSIPLKGFTKDPKLREIIRLKKSNPVDYEKFIEWSNFVLVADSELLHFYHSVLNPMNEIGFLSDRYGLRVDKQKELIAHKLDNLKQIMINETLEWKKDCEKNISDGNFSITDLNESYMHSLMYINLRSKNLSPLEYQDYVTSLIDLCLFDVQFYPKVEAEILNCLMYYRRVHISSPYRFHKSQNENNFFDDRIKGIDYNSYIFNIQNLKEMIDSEKKMLKGIHFDFLNYQVILETSVNYDAETSRKFLFFNLKFKDTRPEEKVDIAVQIRLLSKEPTEHFSNVENKKVDSEMFEIRFDKFMPIEDVLSTKYYKSKKDMIRIDLIIFKRKLMNRV